MATNYITIFSIIRLKVRVQYNKQNYCQVTIQEYTPPALYNVINELHGLLHECLQSYKALYFYTMMVMYWK